MAERPHIVVVGGGFGGLNAAKALRRAPVDVTLIDRRNHHLFQPLLYQVATAALSPGDIAHPIRSALSRQRNARVLLAEARRIDVGEKKVILDSGELAYDYVVLAAGVAHSYFGNEGWETHAPGLKSVEDALEMRRRILTAYEAAERETDPERRAAWLTFVVVGAGPTGVELAGALAEIGRHSMARDFRAIDPTQVRVFLLEGGDRVLPTFPEELSEKARKQLARLGVDVMCGAPVTGVDQGGVVAGETRIAARSVLWAAGVEGPPLAQTLGVPIDGVGRVIVGPDLSVPGHPEMFVIGDMAAIEVDGTPVPGLAPAAMQAGRHAAKNIVRTLRGQTRRRFRYTDKGTLATVGRSKAVGHFRGRWKFGGALAWFLWWAVHLFFLVGFRNRFIVMFGWIWNYLTFQRGARLITGQLPPLPALQKGEKLDSESKVTNDEKKLPTRHSDRRDGDRMARANQSTAHKYEKSGMLAVGT